MRDEQSVPDNRLDGNVLAGPLSEVFAVDVTTAGVTCVACGKRQRLAALEVYGVGPGLTARCTGCHGVILRVARVRDQVHLDLRGTVALRFEL
jgi:hypothetical protein